jgi:hypothetical protein
MVLGAQLRFWGHSDDVVPSKASHRCLLNNAISKAGGIHHSGPEIRKKPHMNLLCTNNLLARVALPVARSAPYTYCRGKVKYKKLNSASGWQAPTQAGAMNSHCPPESIYTTNFSDSLESSFN